MRRDIKSTQREMRLMEFFVDGTGTAALSGPAKNQATLTDNGTGDYTVTFDEPYAQVPIVVATPKTTDILCRVKANAVGSVNIECLGVAVSGATPSVATISEQTASYTHEDVVYYALFPGAAGTSITIAKTTGATAGSEVVTVVNTAGTYAVNVQVEDGVSTAQQVADAIANDAKASNVISARATTAATAQGALVAIALDGGLDAVAGTASATGAVAFTATDADFHLLVISSEITEQY